VVRLTLTAILGVANLLADGFAMGAANYIATKSDRDAYRRLLAIEERHIALVPDGEREEIRQIFAAKGFAGDELERLVAVLTADPGEWARTMAVEEHGSAPVMKHPVFAGGSTFLAFFLAGLVPLLGYVLTRNLVGCTLTAAAAFLAIGAIKSRWMAVPWWRSGLETCAIGLFAAGLAFAVGAGLRWLLGGAVG